MQSIPVISSCNERTETPSIAASPRLARLREAILDAPYRLCTQKAELLTRYLRLHCETGIALKLIEGLHFSAYRSALEGQSRGETQHPFALHFNRQLMRLYQSLDDVSKSDWQSLYAGGLRFILENMELRVYDDELIVGNPSSQRIGAPIHPDFGGVLMLSELETLDRREQNPIELTDKQREVLRDDVFPFWFRRSVLAQTPLFSGNPELPNILTDGTPFILTQFAGISHLTPDYGRVVRHGFRGILKQVSAKQAALRRSLESVTDEQERTGLLEGLKFCQAAETCTQAAIGFGKRWARQLRMLARNHADSARRAELLELAELFDVVPEHPARTFHQALQSIFICHVIVHQESFQHGVSFGRLDQLLLPYYRADREAGRLTDERAVELLGCFLGKAAELLPLFFDRATEYFSGLSSASGITIGGQLADGTDASNEVSHLILLAYDQMRLRQPNIHARVHGGSSQRFLGHCYDILKGGGGIPAFFNDDVVVDGLVDAGVAECDAKDYAVVGCAEWGVPGRSFPAAGAGFINMPFALQLALHNGLWRGKRFGPQTGEPAGFDGIEQLLEAFESQLRNLVALAVEGNNAIEQAHAERRPTPFLSTIVEGCIERGVGVNSGGARYNSSGLQGVGLADVVDSMAAIEQLVFRERRLSLDELIAAVDADFEGHERLLGRITARVAGYGEGESLPDRLAEQVSRIHTDLVAEFENRRGGRYRAGFWTMTTHQGFGRRLGASPGGRRAGKSLANGISARTGRERRGPTASLSSAAGLARVGNGCVLNQKLSPEFVRGEAGSRIIDGLTRGYFKKGGQQVQYNILDADVLIRARANPAQYRDLVVRISGYSAYFNDLTDAMKDEIIDRTLHGVER